MTRFSLVWIFINGPLIKISIPVIIWIFIKTRDSFAKARVAKLEARKNQLDVQLAAARTVDRVTAGIIGDKFIKLTAGGSDIILEAGDEIEETEPSISLEELVSKYIFESE